MLQILINLLIVFGLINVFSWISLALLIYCFEIRNRKKLFCRDHDNICLMLIVGLLPTVVLVILVYNFYLNEEIQNDQQHSIKIRGENPSTISKAEENDQLYSASVGKKRSNFGSRFFNFENNSEKIEVDKKTVNMEISGDQEDQFDEESPKHGSKHNMAFRDFDYQENYKSQVNKLEEKDLEKSYERDANTSNDFEGSYTDSNFENYSRVEIIKNSNRISNSFTVENTLGEQIENEKTAKKKQLKILDKIRKLSDSTSGGNTAKQPSIAHQPKSYAVTKSFNKKNLPKQKLNLDHELEEKIETDSKKMSRKSAIFDNEIMRNSGLHLKEDITN